MSSKIEQIITEIEEYIDNCKFQPLSTSKIVVNKDDIDELLAELRLRTPDEIKKYQKIIANKDAILNDAKERSESMIAEATAHINQLVSEHEIMQKAYSEANQVIEQAQQQAQDILNNATAEANDLRGRAMQYTDDILSLIHISFDASLRFLKEDPWERLRKLRDGFKNTKLQMLFRGQNILGYSHYSDDVVEYFVQKSIANGIDIIRIFDCLNDLRNLETAVKAANKENGHAQIALSYTLGDAYTLDYWKDTAKRIEDMGANSLCIKDMAGLLTPYKATELVQALREGTDIPIDLHTHYTSGVAAMTYMKAVEAGCDIIDTAISPFSMGTSQPATEVMVETFKGTPYDTGLDQKLLKEVADYFKPYREECLANGLLNPKVMGVNINTLLYQVPGGMLSNLVSQLDEMGAACLLYTSLFW